MEAPGIGRNTADIFALIQALFYRLGQEQGVKNGSIF